MEKNRCEWVENNPLSITYHDEEWGNLRQFNNDTYLFEMLTLEGAQAGLSWMTILKRREAYQNAFFGFNLKKNASLTDMDVDLLMQNKGIIRNERKIRSVIKNASCIIQIQTEYGSFHKFLWEFIGEEPIINNWTTREEVPASTAVSKNLSKILKKRDFSFVGPVICYSFLQAIGLIQDHTSTCYLSKGREGN